MVRYQRELRSHLSEGLQQIELPAEVLNRLGNKCCIYTLLAPKGTQLNALDWFENQVFAEDEIKGYPAGTKKYPATQKEKSVPHWHFKPVQLAHSPF